MCFSFALVGRRRCQVNGFERKACRLFEVAKQHYDIAFQLDPYSQKEQAVCNAGTVKLFQILIFPSGFG